VGSDVSILRPGGLVNIRGTGPLYNGSYFVTRVRHTISSGTYEQRFEAKRNAVTETGAELYVEVA
jgi:phage protein D